MNRPHHKTHPGAPAAGVHSWLLLVTVYATALVLVFDARDSGILKPFLLLAGVAVLTAYGAVLSMREGALRLAWSNAHTLFAAYLAASCISWLAAANTGLFLEEIKRQFCYAAMFFAAFQLSGDESFHRRFYNGTLLLTAAIAAVGLLQAVGITDMSGIYVQIDRTVVATFGNATFFGGFLALLSPIVLAAVLTSDGLRRLLLGLLLLVMIYLLILTETRSAWVAFILGILTFTMLAFRSWRINSLIIAGLAVIAVAAGVLFPEMIQRRVGEIADLTVPVSITRRVTFYEAAWKAFLQSPVIGNGAGNMVMFVPPNRSPDYWLTDAEDIVDHVHNEGLEVLSETGILGFIPWLGLMLFIAAALWKAARTAASGDRLVLLGFLSGLAAFMIDNLTSMNFRVAAVAAVFWFIFGLALRRTSVQTVNITLRIPLVLQKAWWAPAAVCAAFLVWHTGNAVDTVESRKQYYQGSLRQDQYPALAIPYFERSSALRPDYADARYALAYNLVRTKDFRSALEHLERLTAAYQSYPKAHLLIAIVRSELGDSAGALAALDRELALATYQTSYHYAALIARRSGDPDREYRYLVAGLEGNIRSGRPEFAENFMLRLGDRSRNGSIDTAQCKHLFLDAAGRFKTHPNLVVTAGAALFQIGFRLEAEAILASLERPSPADSVLYKKYHLLSSALHNPATADTLPAEAH